MNWASKSLFESAQAAKKAFCRVNFAYLAGPTVDFRVGTPFCARNDDMRLAALCARGKKFIFDGPPRSPHVPQTGFMEKLPDWLRSLVPQSSSKETPKGEEQRGHAPELDSLALAKEAASAGLLEQAVVEHLASLHPDVPSAAKQRYLLMHLYKTVNRDEGLFLRMVQVFLKFNTRSGTSCSVRAGSQCSGC